MTLQAGKDAMVTHPLSDVYGSYVIEFDGEARFVTADPELLFEQLEGVEYKDCGKVRVLLLSSEEWSSDDITAFVWEAMVGNYAGTFAHDTLDDWDEHVGVKVAFCRWGYGEFNPHRERMKREAEAKARADRVAKYRAFETPALIAARSAIAKATGASS